MTVGQTQITFHGMRHTCATLLLQAGEPVHVVSKRLGHARVQTTLDTYAHVLPDMQLRPPRRSAACCTVRDQTVIKKAESTDFSQAIWDGVDDGVRTRDFRSHSPALYR